MITKLDNPNVRQFIQNNIKEDSVNLALQAHKYPALPMREIADQVASRQRAEKKLPEWYANDLIIFPPRQNLEQASSERAAVFKSRFLAGTRLLDLTGGTGIDAFYMGQKFAELIIVEPDPDLCELLEHNFKVLEKNVTVIQNTAEEFLKSNNEKFDAIYIDPSRRPDGQTRVFGLGEYLPNVLQLKEQLLSIAGVVLLKTSPMIDISQILREIPEVTEVITLALQNEVKEVLFFLQKERCQEPEITAFNLLQDSEQEFRFQKEEERKTILKYSKPLKFVYEPNTAIRKAGAFKSIANRFRLHKLHSQTHLYTSDERVETFPGKIFRFENFIKPDKKSLKKHFPSGKVNIISKNYPLGANELKKKYGLRDGGDQFLVFCEITELGKSAMICEIDE